MIAFEPLGSEADIYRSILGETEAYTLHEVALGAENGSALIHVSASRDSSSLLPIGKRQSQLFPGTGEVGTELVTVRTLDGYIGELEVALPALLKLDVQGGELEVLRGGALALMSFRWVYLELSFVELYNGQPRADELVGFLADRGFRLVGVGRPSISGGTAVQVDALFERPDAL